MSTRSVIATAHGDTWQGVYHHSDGYPTWLGAMLWKHWVHWGRDLPTFEREMVTNHPGGWSSLRSRCYCHDDAGTEYPEYPRMQYTPEDEQESALFIEWVYVFSRCVLTIYTNAPTGEEQRCENDNGHWWMEPVYRWALVTQVRLDGPEPDWQAIEDAAATNPPTPVAQALAHRL